MRLSGLGAHPPPGRRLGCGTARAALQRQHGQRDDGFFASTEDTFYGYEVGLAMGNGVAILWDTRYLFARRADLRLERRKIMTIETVFSF